MKKCFGFYSINLFTLIIICMIPICSLGQQNHIDTLAIDNNDISFKFKLPAFKKDNPQDYIAYYAHGYYSRWEAEESVLLNADYPGVKHQFGQQETNYWKSETDTSHIGEYLVTGPDYIQDRKYKFWYDTSTITYIVIFRLKIEGSLLGEDTVCELSVRYRTINGDIATLDSMILTVNQLSNDFSNYTLQYTIPPKINGNETAVSRSIISGGYIKYGEEQNKNEYSVPYGVQLNVKWLGYRNLCVDYVDVYDQYIWKNYLENTEDIVTDILSYADTVRTVNTQFWYSLDEPGSIDNYEPYRVVDSILNNNNKPGVITTFYPQWEGRRNGDITLSKFKTLAKPQHVLMDYYKPKSRSTIEDIRKLYKK